MPIFISLGLLAGSPAWATSGFDPSQPAATFTGVETGDHQGSKKLWDRIDRFEDPDRTLFGQSQFNSISRWADAPFTPFVETLFGAAEPHDSAFLLHQARGSADARGIPVLLVHGAGDNASRAWSVLRDELIELERPIYAITFAHPHGEVLGQAETVANAISVINARHGTAQVDVVAHSKGGMAVAAYASHRTGAAWNAPAYEAVGTPFRGDIRRIVFMGTPLGGIDTSYRWSGGNYLGLDADIAISPTSWSTYYPAGSSAWWISQDLEEQDFLSSDGDLFPGQRQLLQRQDFQLPGSMPWLGGFSFQQDWYTTYEGGFGFVSWSDGIDDAIEDGGYFMDTLAGHGLDPDIDVFILAGGNPLMPNGDETFRAVWDGVASASQWDLLLTSIDSFVGSVTWDDAEADGLASGYLVMGEVSGPSDGLVFVDSALDTRTLDARGATIVETRVVDVSHTELLIASARMGSTMKLLAGDDPDNAWQITRGDRYIEADTAGWVADVLSERTGTAQARGEAPSAGADADTAAPRSEGRLGCSSTPAGGHAAVIWFGLLALAPTLRRRNRQA